MLDRIRIVMVNTTHSGNIGAAARAMKNMGLSRLYLADPLAQIDEEAIQRSSRADDILENTVICPSLEDAIAGCGLVVGTSARSRSIPWPLMNPRQCAAQSFTAAKAGNDIALVFGRESRGLTNEELQRCNYHLQIPAAPAYSSLNLAMAVQVVCYELYRQLEASPLDANQWDRAPATSAQLEGLIEHFERVLIDSEFLDPSNPGQTMTRLRRLLTRVTPDETEVQMLRGVLKQLAGTGEK